ncbi:mucosa-associated lymphoid tissue lymphoma translocation protein 1 isoform X1 [Colossoma macropomum]|uniref:mucosa-associated lymphoid tissue lymphoma translocation protein 1 isoform X1 n=1 Tax=Colossoma macropomum TaxID=42526 RepID=UPI0018652803|nr:mucosa-associated lymphoid tissue lymphoma translocation protein 1 isoform X1 [Colossoma macropomum]XP_036417622.1 mucosa-associated lymphoid tissue lymphoma translocation protein 1 isoform X1 [Colossoma macropomum]
MTYCPDRAAPLWSRPFHTLKEGPTVMKVAEVVIVQQPKSVCVPQNYPVTLSVQAVGTGPLRYQWFDGQQKEVPCATESRLQVSLKKSESYICRVSDLYCNCIFSDWVRVKVLNLPVGVQPGWKGEPYIIVQPTPQQTVRHGDTITLKCSAFGMPSPQYQWYHNGHLLPKENKEIIEIKSAKADHVGSYLCSVSNVLEERWSEAADVALATPDNLPAPTLTATDKVALLIGNLNYTHHPRLMAPIMDVHELASLLQQLGFRVVSLLDLTLQEMEAAIDKFLQLLDRGVYAVFYYAGHGYEHLGRNYLVAIDAPRPYRTVNCVCVQRVMCKMQERQAQLNVILLDTCRKWYKQSGPASEINPLAPLGNTVYGYATTEDAEAFEVQDGGKSTGIFTKYLNKYILQPQKVTHILEQVSEDLGKDQLVCGRQVVEIKHTLKEPRALTDPVGTAGHTMELRLRDACWRQANVLPGRKLLDFPCGVQVELSFSALFSNILLVFGTVRNSGPTVQDCTVDLCSEPVMEDIFSGPGRSDEMHSLLLSKGDNPDCSLRLCCLQRLERSLVIKVELHYTHRDRKLRLTECREVDIGRPLIASCRFSHRRPADRRQEAMQHTVGHKSNTRRSSHHPAHHARPSTRKAENVYQISASAASVSTNEPEENDENDLHEFTV